MAEKDIVEKTLESYNDVFADIANALMFGGEQVIRPEDLQDVAPRSAYKAEGKMRDMERDVVKRWTNGSIHIACLGMENQTAADADMPLRVFGYDGAGYRAQLADGSRARYPVITLVLYFGYKKPWDQPITLYEAARVPERLRPFVPDMKLNLYQIAYLTPEQVRLFKSDFRIVADYFVQMRMKEDYTPSQENIRHIQEVLQLLSVMTRNHRFEEKINGAQEGEIRSMKDWLDRVEEQSALRVLINLITKGKLSVKEAAEEANMTVEEFEKKTGLKAMPS